MTGGPLPAAIASLGRRLAVHPVTGPLAVGALVAVAQAPVLASYFMHDDFLHLYMGEALPFGEWLRRPFSGHLMAVHKLCYWALHRLFGLDPTWFFRAALATHALNAALLVVFIRRLTARPLLALFGAAAWGVASVHASTLAWFPCYGQVQAVTFLLVALVELAGFAEARRPPTVGALLRFTALTLLGALSFGLGVATALAFPVIAAVLLPRECRPLRAAAGLLPGALLTLALYSAWHGAERVHPVKLSSSADVEWVLMRSVESFARLWSYGVATLVGGPQLTVNGAGRVVGVLAELPVPVALRIGWVVGALLSAVVVVAAFRADAPRRRTLAGLVLLLGAAYGAVSLARATLLLDITWISTQARYHYGQTLAVTALLAAAVDALLRARPAAPPGGTERGAFARALGPAAAALGLSLVSLRGLPLSDTMTDGFDEASREIVETMGAELAARVRAAPAGSTVYVENSRFTALELLKRLGVERWLFPDLAALHLVLHPAPGALDGRTLRFVEEDAALVARIRATTRPEVAALFVTPAEAEAARAPARVPSTCLYLPKYQFVLNEEETARFRAELEAAPACRPGPRLRATLEREFAENPAAREELARRLRSLAAARARAELEEAVREKWAARAATPPVPAAESAAPSAAPVRPEPPAAAREPAR